MQRRRHSAEEIVAKLCQADVLLAQGQTEELEQENTRLRKAVADLTLDKLMLKETAKGNW